MGRIVKEVGWKKAGERERCVLVTELMGGEHADTLDALVGGGK